MFLSLTFDGALSILTKTRDIYVSSTVALPPKEELAPSERAGRLFGWVWISSPRGEREGANVFQQKCERPLAPDSRAASPLAGVGVAPRPGGRTVSAAPSADGTALHDGLVEDAPGDLQLPIHLPHGVFPGEDVLP